MDILQKNVYALILHSLLGEEKQFTFENAKHSTRRTRFGNMQKLSLTSFSTDRLKPRLQRYICLKLR